MLTNNDIQGIFGDYFKGETIRFNGFTTFKYSRKFNVKKARFVVNITDYLKGGNREMMEEIAPRMLQRFMGRNISVTGPCTIRYLASDAFVNRNRPIYLRRARNIVDNPQGRSYNIDEMYHELVDDDIIRPVPNVRFTWSKKNNVRLMGQAYPIMRTITLNSLMDNAKVPMELSKFVLYHELLHIIGMDFTRVKGERYHTTEFREMERAYPNAVELDKKLSKLAYCAKNNIDIS